MFEAKNRSIGIEQLQVPVNTGENLFYQVQTYNALTNDIQNVRYMML